ncbi:MAG: deoxyguanosinetriphosphate triphosphohydrolase [Candidatus Xenolissoclinum pacificiensis L6]|uniref:Deoxyguanosinetriphosphate triphosphohydrolase-like protein n=1 Tax=Candidatus Xenolissoclinum pacificiensis L6 TaxID=1401685 RepID=W2V2H4_9RICK|nr:MAG: deoxyguanosinetriphosphate triphosphohydrolase [Candidatus Xenolissoclinum pacificiensis L6]
MISHLATPDKDSIPRFYPEHIHNISGFESDRARIIHSSSFRKLGYKTQIFLNYAGDLYRTRLTHTMEVAQVSRTIAKKLGLNDTLAETIALAHDLGHSPFGHSGERALQSISSSFEPFNHNLQTIRIVTALERTENNFPGLNLSITTLDGIIKHNGPIYDNIPESIAKFAKLYNLELNYFPSLEAQVAAISDDIAYIVHDIDDGIRANLIAINDIIDVLPKLENMIKTHQNEKQMLSSFLNSLRNMFIDDVIQNSLNTLDKVYINELSDMRSKKLIDFSSHVKNIATTIKLILMQKVYRHHNILKISFTTQKIIVDLFKAFFESVELLPPDWYNLVQKSDQKVEKYRIICDYISGMTDRFAIYQHQKLFNINYSIGYY